MKKAIIFALVAGLSTSLTSAAFANELAHGDANKGRTLSATCAACHGADGNSVNPDWPTLAGQGEAYIMKQLHDFRGDKRVDPLMSAQAKGIKSDADIADLAAYFSSQKTKLGTANKDKVALGKAIYKGGILSTGVAACSACHGPTGLGNFAAKFPKVSGQHAKYIVKQLKAFKSGSRNNDSGKMMRNIAKNMTDAEMEAVAEYMTGLHD